MLGTEIKLHVPDHVKKDPAEQEHTGHGHHRFLADGGPVERSEPRGGKIGGDCGHFANDIEDARWVKITYSPRSAFP